MTESADLGSPPGSVLIVKPSSLGDVVTALPVLRGLRRTFPQVRIAWFVARALAPVLSGEDDLDEVIPFDRPLLGRAWRSPRAATALWALVRRLGREGFDWALDLQGLWRSGFFTAVTRARLRAGFADAREGAGVFYTHRIPVAERHTVDRNIALDSMAHQAVPAPPLAPLRGRAGQAAAAGDRGGERRRAAMPGRGPGRR